MKKSDSILDALSRHQLKAALRQCSEDTRLLGYLDYTFPRDSKLDNGKERIVKIDTTTELKV